MPTRQHPSSPVERARLRRALAIVRHLPDRDRHLQHVQRRYRGFVRRCPNRTRDEQMALAAGAHAVQHGLPADVLLAALRVRLGFGPRAESGPSSAR